MGCVNADGSLTVVAVRVLRALATSAAAGTAESIAAAVGMPVYRARVSLRELRAAGLITEDLRVSETGLARLKTAA